MRALEGVGRALTASLDPAVVLRSLLIEIRNLVGTEGAGALRHDAKSDELVMVAANGAGLEGVVGQRLPATAGILGTAFSEQRGMVVEDVRGHPRFYRGLPGLSAVTLRSILVVPMTVGGRTLGVLGTINKIVGAFTEDDARVLAAIANAAAAAIENAELFAAEQNRRKQLEAVRAVANEITRELDLTNVLRLITQRAGELIGSRPAKVWLWDENEQVLTPAVWPSGSEWLRGQRLRLGEGLVGVVAEQRRGVIVNDYPHWGKAIPAMLGRGVITAVVGEPLLYRNRLLGVLVVDNEGLRRTFEQADGDALALFASHAAIAIQNARLFHEIEVGRARLEGLSRRLVEVQEVERRYISRELHDEVGQLLTALKLKVETSGCGSAEPCKGDLRDAGALVQDLLTRVRELSLDLRPAMLDDLGLVPALIWQFGHYLSRTRIQVIFKHVGLEGRRFAAEVETAVYRIIQESLTNVARHAKVSEVTVRAWVGETTLFTQIEDRGVGFDAETVLAAHTGSGLTGMLERTNLLSGRFAVESAPGRGTCVTAEFPIG